MIAEAGIASRRAAEKLIQTDKVRVNGKIVRILGTKVNPNLDKIEVNGKPLSQKQIQKKYYLFHKPIGVTTTLSDPHAKKTVVDFFKDIPERLFPAGRLDQNSTGLLLMTNDGELVNRLTHPRFGVKKCYQVEVDRDLTEAELHQFKIGILLDGKKTAPCHIAKVSKNPNGHARFKVTLHEGRKRQIRMMMKKLNANVITLHRETYGPLFLGNLKSGEKRLLTPHEIESLVKAIFP